AGLQIPIEPAVLGALDAGRRAFHVVLRVEVQPRAVGRAARVHDRQLAAIPQRLERLEPRVEAEEPVEIDRRALAGVRARDGDARPRAVVLALTERDDDVEAVHGAALEDRDELPRPGR